ncbi:hypothetical protein GGF50DRAFT_68365, partial [Schizophyllum commune]
RSGVLPQLKYVKFDCRKGGGVQGPSLRDASRELKMSYCPNCESKGRFTVNSEQTVYRNYQKMTLQESPGSVLARRLPRHRDVNLLWDLIDSTKPGDEVEITGIYRNNLDASLNSNDGFPVFTTVIEVKHVHKNKDLFSAFRLTGEDRREMRNLAKDERIRKRIIKSIAPSIYGYKDITSAIAHPAFEQATEEVDVTPTLDADVSSCALTLVYSDHLAAHRSSPKTSSASASTTRARTSRPSYTTWAGGSSRACSPTSAASGSPRAPSQSPCVT